MKIYNLLGISVTADENAVRKAYKRKLKEVHPDLGGTAKDFIELTNAFADYEESLKGGKPRKFGRIGFGKSLFDLIEY